MTKAIAELIIGISYGLIVGAFTVALVRLLLVREDGFVRGKSFWAVCLLLLLLDLVFVFCGSEYLTDTHSPEVHHLIEVFFLSPLSICLAIACNPVTAWLGFGEIKALTQKPKELTIAKEQLEALSKSTVSCLAIAKMVVPYKEIQVVWCSQAFKEWYATTLGEKAKPEIIGVNWYKVFPALSRWKNDHAKVYLTQDVLQNNFDHWEEQDKYLNWAIMPAGQYQIWSFVDLTDIGRQTALVVQQRDKLLSLGLEHINDV